MLSRPCLWPLFLFLLVTLTVTPASSAFPQRQRRKSSSSTVYVTPHESYSSSVGVLGCKVDTNRIAYWPGSVDCDRLCVKLSYEDRHVFLLRVDQSQGAYDVSYDAWNYLCTGKSARDKPTAGGAIAMQYEDADPDDCADLLKTHKKRLPLSAPNSMNFLASCLNQTDSWVSKNYVLYNILDSICTLGRNQECHLDWPNANQPSCPNQLGLPDELTSEPVYNIKYPTGELVKAGTNNVVEDNSPSFTVPWKWALAVIPLAMI